ncbi:MAG: hypothetical protein M1832_001900 [Thelocarpon impressellum]|nr:MAG: hypothetical protein M1832_001900 [Thelocarpon impressellum]
MATQGQFNTKSPTIKRILREAAELSTSPSSDYHAAPLETNLFDWHFILRGPPAPSPYAQGFYHGRIVLPPTYPLRPPSFRFLTPTGRFETNREICLSISGHHEETWQPAWGIRTALVALRSFMDQEAKGQVGGLDTEEGVRRKLAATSRVWRCAGCGGRTNEDIMREVELAVEAAEKDDSKAGQRLGGAEEVPRELRLAYKDDMESSKNEQGSSASTPPILEADQAARRHSPDPRATRTTSSQANTAQPANPAPQPTRTIQLPPQVVPPVPQRSADGVPAWLDQAIGGLVVCLAAMIMKKILGF